MAEVTAGAAQDRGEPKHITPLMRKIWGIGVFGEGFNMSPGQLYRNYFQTTIIGVPPTVLAAIAGVSVFTGFLAAPIGSRLVDGIKPMKWGKLRSWLLVGSIISFAMSWFPWVQWGTPEQHAWIVWSVGLLTAWFYNAQVISTFALVPSMCYYDEERSTLASNNMTGNKLGTLLAGFIVPLVMNVVEPRFGRMSYMVVAVVCNAVMFACYMVHFKLSEGYEGNGQIIANAGKKPLTLKEAGVAIAAVPSLLPMIFADITSTVGAFLLPPFVVYLYRYVVNDGQSFGMMAVHNLCIGIAGVIGSWTSRLWLTKVHDKKNICLMLYPLMALFIFAARFFTDTLPLFIFCVAMAMLFQGTTNPVENTFYYDMATVAQLKTGTDPTPTFIAIQQFGPGVAGIISTNTLAWTLVLMDYTPGVEITQQVKDGFLNGYCVAPTIIFLLGWIALFFFYKITPEMVADAKAEIIARGDELISEEALDVD